MNNAVQKHKIVESLGYIRKIHNPNKRLYAEILFQWYKEGKGDLPLAIPPEPTISIPFMVKQAVQHKFNKIWYEPF